MRSFSQTRQPAPRAQPANSSVPRLAVSSGEGQGQHHFSRVRVQAGSQVPGKEIHSLVDLGVAGSGQRLPFLNDVQQSFGRHDVTSVLAYTDGNAAKATHQLGALALTRGNQVAFGQAPSLHTAAHEAAHVIQQRAGVHLENGVGRIGDDYERHADAVADLVVAGRTAGPLLDSFSGVARGDTARQPVQMQLQEKEKSAEALLPPFMPDRKMFEEWAVTSAIKQPIADKLAHEYVNRWRPPVVPHAIPTYSGGLSPVFQEPSEPSEARVALAIFRSIDIARTGKGDQWSWKWAAPPQGRPKTPDEKVWEMAKWGGKHVAEDKIEEKVEEFAVEKVASPALNYLRGTKAAAVEEGALANRLAKGKAKNVALRWIAKDLLGLSVEVVAVVSGAAEVIGFVMLAFEIADLLKSLGEPGDLKPWQVTDQSIVAGVQAYLQGKQDAADLEKALAKPFQPLFHETRRDKTLAVPR